MDEENIHTLWVYVFIQFISLKIKSSQNGLFFDVDHFLL